MVRICVFGLGEAGSEIAGALAAAGAEVAGYDPAQVATPEGVRRHSSPVDAVRGVDAVITLTAASDAMAALAQSLEEITAGTHYADFSTASPGLKQQLASTAEGRGLLFTDVALMGPVPGRGVRTPAVASGKGAQPLADALRPFGMELRVVGGDPGTAATHKLLRSVVVKGLTASLVEAMKAAEASELGQEIWAEAVHQLTNIDEGLVRRLVAGTERHARRRHDEMVAAADLLDSLGVEPIMSRATVEALAAVIESGAPVLPPEEGQG